MFSKHVYDKKLQNLKQEIRDLEWKRQKTGTRWVLSIYALIIYNLLISGIYFGK